jgi:hypothetical protein
MTHQPLTLTLEPAAPDALSEPELDALTRTLARQLDAPELTESVQLPEAGPLEPGAKGLRSAIGKLVLAVAPETAPALVGFLKDWVTRAQRVKLKVQVGDRLIEGDFDPRSTDPAEFEALAGRLLERLGG